MRTIISTLFCLCLLLSALPASAQAPESWTPDGPRMHAESALNALVTGNAKEGFSILFSKGRYPASTLEKIQFDYFQLVKKQGPPSSWERIFEQKAGSSIVRMKYVLLFKTQPMIFDLYYYNMGKTWVLKTFTLSRDIKKVFER